MSQTVSVIIPTHNRCKTLSALLQLLERQSYPLSLLEVVVVADGCHDATVDMLCHYQAPYQLRYLQQDGQGPAIARNAGAAAATGSLLLFLDDDIEPSDQLVEAHVQAHRTLNQVVVGYLPFCMPAHSGFYHQQLRLWWENKFQQMRKPGYRYSYDDLLSGNFSLSAHLFNQVKGFDTSLRCREDYELGLRLIAANAEFVFVREAWGYHRDEVTDFTRSLWRKQQEGRADVQFVGLHPGLSSTLRLSTLQRPTPHFQFFLARMAFRSPRLAAGLANVFYQAAKLLERLHLRIMWNMLSEGLHEYWYFRGVHDSLPRAVAKQNLASYFPPPAAQVNEAIELDLLAGLDVVEQQLDQLRPASVRFVYGSQFVGSIPFQAGAERLRGAHLRQLLATTLAWPLTQVLLIAGVVTNPQTTTQAQPPAPAHV